MKRKIFIIIFIFILMIGACMILFGKKIFKEKELADIKSLHYGYTTGTMAYSDVYYDLTLEHDGYYLEIKLNGVSDDEKEKIEISHDDVEEIKKILKKYNVKRWDGFNKSDKYVLDGNSFSFSVNFIDGDSINAHGYMMYPKNYGEVTNSLEDLFMSFYERKK